MFGSSLDLSQKVRHTLHNAALPEVAISRSNAGPYIYRKDMVALGLSTSAQTCFPRQATPLPGGRSALAPVRRPRGGCAEVTSCLSSSEVSEVQWRRFRRAEAQQSVSARCPEPSSVPAHRTRQPNTGVLAARLPFWHEHSEARYVIVPDGDSGPRRPLAEPTSPKSA